MASTEIISKIVPKSIGNPKGIHGLKEDDHAPFVLGLMGGRANKMVMRTMPNGDVYHGLGGQFVGIPFTRQADGTYAPDTTKKRLSSGVMYLPSGIQDTIQDQLVDTDTGEVREGIEVEFMFEAATIRASNPAGYSWSFTPLVQASAAGDPLASLITAAGFGDEKFLPVSNATTAQGQLEPPKDDAGAGDTPPTTEAAKAPAKGRGK